MAKMMRLIWENEKEQKEKKLAKIKKERIRVLLRPIVMALL